MPAVVDLLRSYFSSAWNDAWRAFDPLPDTLPEKNAHIVPPNIAHGNSPLDDLFYWLIRESVRALARSLFGVELENVSPYTVSAGHAHDQNPDAAMAWNAPTCTTLWFDNSNVTEVGAGTIDQTTEVDIAWVPFDQPDGTELSYFRLRVGSQAANDIGYLRVRVYKTTVLNGSPIAQSAFVEIRSKDGGTSPLPDQWVEFGPLNCSTLTVTDNIKEGYARISGLVATAGDKIWVGEIQQGLREGV